MVISINGNLVDTKAISAISNIIDDGYGYEFTITLYNNSRNITIMEEDGRAARKDLEDLRDNIVKIWLENKLDVPTFNLKSFDNTHTTS